MKPLACMVIDCIEVMKDRTGDTTNSFTVTAHPTLKKRVLREHVKQTCKEAGLNVAFRYEQTVGENKIVVQKNS